MTKRTVATPGQDPNTQQNDAAQTDGQAAGQAADATAADTTRAQAPAAADAFQASSAIAGDQDTGGMQEQIDELKDSQQILLDQNAALADQVRQLLAAGLRVAQAQAPAVVELPNETDAEVLASKVPVLTKQGWFVPESKVWAVTANKGN